LADGIAFCLVSSEKAVSGKAFFRAESLGVESRRKLGLLKCLTSEIQYASRLRVAGGRQIFVVEGHGRGYRWLRGIAGARARRNHFLIASVLLSDVQRAAKGRTIERARVYRY
jgi:hypothetical protein